MSEDSDVVAEPRGVVDAVDASFSPGVIRIRLQRPPVNALTVQVIDRLRATFAAIHDDPRPVMLCGLPRVFSAGFDVKAPADDPQAASDAATACLDAVRTHPGPTVAAVEGAAVGLGLLIAASADILVTLGIASDVDGLRRFLPEMWVRRLCLSGEPFTAEQLHLEAGGAMVCEPGTCEAAAEAIAGQLAALRPQFVRDAKLGLRR
jgi:enoyl-CoA hydratase/carnithine racemase